MNFDALKSQFEWLINGDSIIRNVHENLGKHLKVLEQFLR
jgi:hypothetical protein